MPSHVESFPNNTTHVAMICSPPCHVRALLVRNSNCVFKRMLYNNGVYRKQIYEFYLT